MKSCLMVIIFDKNDPPIARPSQLNFNIIKQILYFVLIFSAFKQFSNNAKFCLNHCHMEICMVTYILFWLTLCIYVYASCMQIINKLLFQIFKFFFKLNFKLKNHSNYGIFQHPKFFIEG